MKVMVYCNDAASTIEHIRRLLSVCEYLLKTIPGVSILMISGSVSLPNFHVTQQLDYIKLPSLNQPISASIGSPWLGADVQSIVKFRSDIILSAAINFQPDVILVDEKPYGIADELKRTIAYLRTDSKPIKFVLLLQDILDHPSQVIPDWEQQGYYAAIGNDYDQVLVMGMQEVWNTPREYHFSAAIKQKVHFCGYMRYPADYQQIAVVRQELEMLPHQRLVVVAPDSDADGYEVIANYLQGLAILPQAEQIQTLIFTGSEMPEAKRQTLREAASLLDRVILKENADDLMRYLVAADAVVAMGGYDMICQIFSAGTPAVIIPKVKPSQEQFMRVARLKKLGLLKAIHPDRLTPEYLMELLWKQLHRDPLKPSFKLDLEALPRISKHLLRLTKAIEQPRFESKRDRRSNPDRREHFFSFPQHLEIASCYSNKHFPKKWINHAHAQSQLRLIVP